MRGPPDYEKASKQHATDGKDIRRATDTDLFASQRKLGEDPAGFAERAGAGPRRSGLHACAGYNRRDQLDLIGASLAALSGVATGFGRSLDQRPCLPCLTIIAPPQPDVCWKRSAHVLRVRARSLSTPMRRSRVRQHRTQWRPRAHIVELEKTGARASELVVTCYANYADEQLRQSLGGIRSWGLCDVRYR